MSGTIIVGFEDTEEGRDALALGPVLGGLLGSTPLICQVSELAESADGPPGTVSADTPAHGLNRLARETGAKAIVLGSSRLGSRDGVWHGNTDEHALHSAPCAVAVAPTGFADRGLRRVGRIAVGYDGSEAASAALDTAVDMALRSGAELTLIGVVEGQRIPYGGAAPATEFERVAEDRVADTLAEGLVRVPADVTVTTQLLHGDAGSRLLRVSSDFDLIVIGARANPPARRLFLGSASRRLFRSAACPVLALPGPDDVAAVEPDAGLASLPELR
jgi:nucleotide-binding universal stress UspA family protein